MTNTTDTAFDEDAQTLNVVADDLTPAERRRKRVRELILAAADKVFAEEGVEGLSIRRLADEIDYSPAAIYKYFGSKEDLVDELKQAFFARLRAGLEETRAAHDDFLAQFKACIVKYVDVALARPHHYAAAFSGVVLEDPVADEVSWCGFLESNSGRAYAMLRDMMAEGVSLGLFPSINPSVASKSLWASMHGVAMLMIHLRHFPGNFPDAEQMDRDAFVRAHADLLIRSLSAPEI